MSIATSMISTSLFDNNMSDGHHIQTFKDLQVVLLEKKIETILNNDAKRTNPVITRVPDGFVSSLANKILFSPYSCMTIGVTGESAAGKSTFVETVKSELENLQENCCHNLLTKMSGDNYFNDISHEIKELGSFEALLYNGYNPDAPTSFQLTQMKKDIKQLLKGNQIKIPKYVINGTGVSIPNCVPKEPARIILGEGIAVLYPEIRDIFDIGIYVDIEENERKERFIKRAIEERHQDLEGAEKLWDTINESAKQYIRPTKKHADMIINGKASIEDFRAITRELFNAVDELTNQTALV